MLHFSSTFTQLQARYVRLFYLSAFFLFMGLQSTSAQITMYFKKPTTWANAKIYYWNATPTGVYPTPAWPGVNMNPDCGDWYKFTFTGITSVNVIFTDGSGNQTIDLTGQTVTRYAEPNSTTGNAITVNWTNTPPSSYIPVTVLSINPAGPINFTSSQTVNITANSCGNPATIYYTTDGSTPTVSSTSVVGTGNLNFTQTTTLKAFASYASQTTAVQTHIYTKQVAPPLPVLPDPQVMMQAWYWDYPKTGHGASWADTLKNKALDLKSSGISHIWFPPHVPASFGNKSNAYDPQDLFMGNTTTGLGTRPAFNAMMQEFANQGIKPVGDMIYNHRDGGKAENNSAVKSYVTTNMAVGKAPFPSDRFRNIIPIGGVTGNGAGTYYFKVSSKTNDAGFNNKTYKFYVETKKKGWQNLTDQTEVEPNGGGNCTPTSASTVVQLGRNMNATLEAGASVTCNVDEFQLNLSASDFYAVGDTLTIFLTNTGNGGYSDHRIYEVYRINTNGTPANANIVSQMAYQTYTDFTNLPSGRGQMNFENFKPNSANVTTTQLSGDWDAMYFFYDYDQFQPQTRDTLIAWTKWSWDIGIRGLRMDAIKHFTPDFVGDMLNAMHADNKIPDLVVGEWYGADVTGQKNWINAVNARMNTAAKVAIKPKVFDFWVRDQLKAASDNNGDPRTAFYNNLHDGGGVSGFNIVPFLNNHDFRANNPTDWDALVHNDAILGYAYLLTNNQLGVPTIFYPDYYGYPATQNVTLGGQPRKIFVVGVDTLYFDYMPQGKPAYKPQIDKLLKVLKSYINGSQGADYLNNYGNTVPTPNNYILGTPNKSMIYQMHSTGSVSGKEIVVAINYGTTRLRVDHKITETRNGVQRRNTPGGIAGTKFNDVLGNSAYSQAVVDEQGRIFIDIPPKSYSVWIQETCPTGTMETVNSGDWNEPLTWSCGRVPTLTDEVIINPTHAVEVKVPVQVKKLIFKNNARLKYIGTGVVNLNP
jgi:hypothetical protein